MYTPCVSLFLQQLPYPKYVRDVFLSSAIGLLPLLLVMSYLYSAGIFIKVRGGAGVGGVGGVGGQEWEGQEEWEGGRGGRGRRSRRGRRS